VFLFLERQFNTIDGYMLVIKTGSLTVFQHEKNFIDV